MFAALSAGQAGPPPHMADFAKDPSSWMTVRFQDCDPFNHLNNGRYVDYFLNAREDHLLEHYDLDIYRIARETGLSWVVSTSQIAYLKPAFLMEKVRITSQLIAYGRKHVAVEMRMMDAGGEKLKALCWMGFVHFDLKQNKVNEHSPDYISLFERVVLPVEQASFDERLKVLSGRKTAPAA